MQKAIIVNFKTKEKIISDKKRKLEYDRVQEMILFQETLILRLLARPKIIYTGSKIYEAMEKQYLDKVKEIDFKKVSVRKIESFIRKLNNERFVFKITEYKGEETFIRNYNVKNTDAAFVFDYSNVDEDGNGYTINFYKPTLEQYYYYFYLL